MGWMEISVVRVLGTTNTTNLCSIDEEAYLQGGTNICCTMSSLGIIIDKSDLSNIKDFILDLEI